MKYEPIRGCGELGIEFSNVEGDGARVTRDFLAELLKNIVKRSTKYYEETEEHAFTYRERQLHSVVCPSIADITSSYLMENPLIRKPAGEEEYRGSVDYWISYNNYSFLMELKHTFFAYRSADNLNYVIVMFRRGICRVYSTTHSQWQDRLTRRTVTNLYLFTPGLLLDECGRDTCLECPELPTCEKNIYPRYERKRAEAIRYYQAEGAKELKRAEESKHKTSFAEIVQTAAKERMSFLSLDGTDYLVADLMARFDIGHNKALDIRSWLLKHFPLKPGKSP